MRSITIDIIHPKHGPAHCNPDQLPEMEALGWQRADAKAEKPAPTGDGKGKGKGKTDDQGSAQA